jgi:hypothetical protein
MIVRYKDKRFKIINGMFFEYNEEFNLLMAEPLLDIKLTEEFKIEEGQNGF